MIADALSRVCPLPSSYSKTKESNIDVIPVYHIMQNALISRTRLQELRLATQSDPTLCSLSKTIQEGLPQSKKDYPKRVLEIWDFRQEISEQNGILYKSHRLIVPHSERLESYIWQNATESTRDRILAWNQQRHHQTIPELQDLP